MKKPYSLGCVQQQLMNYLCRVKMSSAVPLMLLLLVTLLVPGDTKQSGPGSPFDGNPEDKDIKYFLNKAVEKINNESNVEPKIVVKILSVKQQVVSGMKFNITYTAEGKVSKNDYICRIVLLDQPWVSQEPQVLERHCTLIIKRKDANCTHGPHY